MTTVTTRRFATGLIGLTAAAGLAACGTTTVATSSVGAPEKPEVGKTVDAEQFVSDMTTALREQKSYHAEAQVTSEDTSLSLTSDVSLEKPTKARVKVTTSGDSSAQMKDVELRLVDKVAYVKMGDLTSQKFWKLDPNDPKSPVNDAPFDITALSEDVNIDAVLDAMTKDVKSVTYRGDEELDGRSCARYTLVAGTEATQAEIERQAKSLASEMEKSGKSRSSREDSGDSPTSSPVSPTSTHSAPAEFTSEIWLDDASLLCKTETEVDGTKLTATASKWGEPVNVEVPAAGDLTTTPNLQQMMQKADRDGAADKA